MADERFAEHLAAPRGALPDGAHTGAAGGAACGDLVRVSLRVEGSRVAAAGADASGCAAVRAAASAAVALCDGADALDAARVDANAIAGELGGLTPAAQHAAELTADALHRALGAAVAANCVANAPSGDAIATQNGPERVLVAMSGGVDSAVAALLTAQSGAEVVAVTLELWASPENDAERSCCSAAAVRGARALAHDLGLPHLTLDLREEFRAGVVEPWIADHAAGLTPNPCVRCNGSVRLDAMVKLADRLGATHLVTGHYARIDEHGTLRTAQDAGKDQSYVLAAVPETTRTRLRFPLGDLEKRDVRALAAEHGVRVASKPDSQDLCFLAGTGKQAFLQRHGGLRPIPGQIIEEGTEAVLGTHTDANAFTVGQRRGIGLSGGPWFVTGKSGGEVRVGPRDALARHEVRVRSLSMSAPATSVRFRYHGKAFACHLDGERVLTQEPVLGAAPGQAAVFYDGDAVVGCATIV